RPQRVPRHWLGHRAHQLRVDLRLRGVPGTEGGRTMIQAVASLFLLAVGMTFIYIAAIGVARLPDVFQRMHAATKTGGIGTTSLLLGVLLADGTVRPVTGLLTIGVTLLTLSVASQLLSRAAYMSGATVHGLEGRRAFAGVLDRGAVPRGGGRRRTAEVSLTTPASAAAASGPGSRRPPRSVRPGSRGGAPRRGRSRGSCPDARRDA